MSKFFLGSAGRQARVRRRSAIVVATATAGAIAAGFVQAPAQAATSSTAVRSEAFVNNHPGVGCRVGNTFHIDSSVEEAGNINIRFLADNGESGRDVIVQQQTNYEAGKKQFAVTAFADVHGVAAQDCTAQKLASFKGRNLGQVPGWAKSLLVADATTSIYPFMTVLTTAFVSSVTGVAGSRSAAVVGAAVAGAASRLLASKVTGTPVDDATVSSILTSRLLSGGVARGFEPLLSKVAIWLVSGSTPSIVRASAVNWMGGGLDATLARLAGVVSNARA